MPGSNGICLCWASATFDETIFEAPEEVRLNRQPNPHIAYGIGPHLCLGAAHARLIVRTLLRKLCAQVQSITLLEAIPNLEVETAYQRHNAWESLTVRLLSAAPPAPPPARWGKSTVSFLPYLEEFLASEWNSLHHAGNSAPNSYPYPMIPYSPDIPAGDKVEHSPAILPVNQ